MNASKSNRTHGDRVIEAEASDMSSGEASILTAAKALFAERGYASTTIKDIAVAAGYSPALGHEDLRQQSSAVLGCDPVRTSDGRGSECRTPPETSAVNWVEKLVARRESDETDPWAMLAVHVHEAPDPAAARAEIKQRLRSRDRAPHRRHGARFGTQPDRRLTAARTGHRHADARNSSVRIHCRRRI